MQAEPDQSDIGPFPGSNRADLLDVDLARDHLVPETGHDLGEELEPLSLFVGDQDAEVRAFVPGHGYTKSSAVWAIAARTVVNLHGRAATIGAVTPRGARSDPAPLKIRP